MNIKRGWSKLVAQFRMAAYYARSFIFLVRKRLNDWLNQ